MTEIEPQIKKFTTKKKAAQVDRARVEFEIDNVKCVAIEPEDFVFAQLAAAASRQARDADQLAATFGFLDDVLESATSRHLHGRLKDREDPYDLEDLGELLSFLSGEFEKIRKNRRDEDIATNGTREERRRAGQRGKKKAVAGPKVIDSTVVDDEDEDEE